MGAKAVSVDDILGVEADVLAPCALGGILNDNTIPNLKVPIIAGGSNNQLLDEDKHGQILHDKGILYSPDYVINAGGLINVAHELKGYDQNAAKEEARGIYGTMLEVFETAEKENVPTHVASDKIAEKRLAEERQGPSRMLNKTFDNQDWITV